MRAPDGQGWALCLIALAGAALGAVPVLVVAAPTAEEEPALEPVIPRPARAEGPVASDAAILKDARAALAAGDPARAATLVADRSDPGARRVFGRATARLDLERTAPPRRR